MKKQVKTIGLVYPRFLNMIDLGKHIKNIEAKTNYTIETTQKFD